MFFYYIKSEIRNFIAIVCEFIEYLTFFLMRKSGFLRAKFNKKYDIRLFKQKRESHYLVLSPILENGTKFYPVQNNSFVRHFSDTGEDISDEGIDAGVFLDGSCVIVEWFLTREEAENFCKEKNENAAL